MSKPVIEFSIPGLYAKSRYNMIFLSYMEEHRNYFYDDVKIGSCYGSFPCAWNGGRTICGEYDDNDIMAVLLFLNSKGISARYTFTNFFIEDHLDDKDGDAILRITKKYGLIPNGINTSSDKFRDYVNKKYPGFYYLISTTLAKTDISEINELSKNFIVVPDYSLNNDYDKLSQLENKDNIEILIDEACVDNCPKRQEHYQFLSKYQAEGESAGTWVCPYGCEYYYFYDITKKKHYVSIDDIRKKYVPLGFTNFKISGRTDNFVNLTEKYVNYLVKPRYKNIVRNELLIKTLFE